MSSILTALKKAELQAAPHKTGSPVMNHAVLRHAAAFQARRRRVHIRLSVLLMAIVIILMLTAVFWVSRFYAPAPAVHTDQHDASTGTTDRQLSDAIPKTHTRLNAPPDNNDSLIPSAMPRVRLDDEHSTETQNRPTTAPGAPASDETPAAAPPGNAPIMPMHEASEPVHPIDAPRPASRPAIAAAPPHVNLQAIVWSESKDRRMVVINGTIAKEGDVLQDFVIQRIDPEKVLVLSADKQFFIKFSAKSD